MALSSVAGVFSRYFVVGFFLPAFFTLLALSQALSADALPPVYGKIDDDGTRVLLIGGAAVLVGLVLLGLHYSVLRLLEGYPLSAHKNQPAVGWLHKRLLDRQVTRYKKLYAQTRLSDEDQRRVARWYLDNSFSDEGPEPQTKLLPTSFGNALRAFERHGINRWGLNSIAAWSRVELFMSQQEAEVLANEKSDVAFFVNGAVMSVVVGAALVVDAAVNHPMPWYALPLYALPFVLAYFAYRSAVGAVTRWGSVVRSIMDVHRLELYEKLGVRTPQTFTEEREVIAPAISQCLLFGDPIPDSLSAKDDRQEGEMSPTLNIPAIDSNYSTIAIGRPVAETPGPDQPDPSPEPGPLPGNPVRPAAKRPKPGEPGGPEPFGPLPGNPVGPSTQPPVTKPR